MRDTAAMQAATIDVIALHAAVDAKRQALGQSWRELAQTLSISRATFARMARGQRPDADAFVTLVRWLDLPAERFVRPPKNSLPVSDGSMARSAMRLTVVGSGAGTRMADEANSGYLVTDGATSLLLDCGPGVATRLRRHTHLDTLAAVILSHTHFDNYYDLLPLAVMVYGDVVSPFVWEDKQPNLPTAPTRLSVYLPPGGVAEIEPVLKLIGDRLPSIGRAFAATLDLHEYRPNAPFEVGPFEVLPIGPVAHGPGSCFGFRATNGHATLGYTGDSAMCDALYDIAREADLFLSDATGITSRVRRSRHISADEAGRVAARAGAKHLVLTHIASTAPSWRDAMIQAAAAHYAGTVTVARDGDVFTIPAY